MATITTNMGLTKWDSVSDPFSHVQLAANFAIIDGHDHVPVSSGGNGGTPIPTAAIQTGAVTNAKLATDSVATVNVQDGAITPAKLSTGLDSTYHLLASHRGTSVSGPVAGSYYLLESRDGINTMGSTTAFDATTFFFNPADYTVSGRTTKARIQAELFTNSVAPNTNWTIGLFPVTSVGGSSGQVPFVATLGSVVASVQFVSFVLLPLQMWHATSSDFTLPAQGFYALVVTNSANSAAGSVVTVKAQFRCHVL